MLIMQMFKDKIMAEILRNRKEELNILKQQLKKEYQGRLQSSLHEQHNNES